MALLSVILPAYNEEKMISKVVTRLGDLFLENRIQYELVFVDDGSTDNTWAEIEKAGADSHVVGVHFSKNFGKVMEAIAKEAIGQAIKATGNTPAELVYNTACLFTSDNLLEATNNAIKVIQNVDEISRS